MRPEITESRKHLFGLNWPLTWRLSQTIQMFICQISELTIPLFDSVN